MSGIVEKIEVAASPQEKEDILVTAIVALQEEVELLKRQMHQHQHVTISRSGGFTSNRTVHL